MRYPSTLRGGLRSGFHNRLAERAEDALHVVARLRGAEEVRRIERFRRLLHLFLAERRLIFEVHLVDCEGDGNFPHGRKTDSTHESRSSRVSYRVTSATARIPWAP